MGSKGLELGTNAAPPHAAAVGHGRGAAYGYSLARLWVRRTRAWLAANKDIYIYFDNDQNGYAVHNAIALSARLASSRSTARATSRAKLRRA